MTTSQPNPTDDLEAVARIIDPEAFASTVDEPRIVQVRAGIRIREAEAKAAAILAALRPAGVGEPVPFGYIPRKTYDQLAQGPKDKRWGGVTVVMPGLAMKNEDLVPLYTNPPHPDAALMERVREGLTELQRWLRYDVPARSIRAAIALRTVNQLLSDLKAEAGR